MLFAALGTSCLGVAPAAVAILPAPEPYPTSAPRLSALPGRAGNAPALRCLAALEEETQARWQVTWDPVLGTGRWGTGGGPVSAYRASDRDIETRAAAHLQALAPLLGADGATLQSVRRAFRSGAWHVTWKQTSAARRVLGSWLDLTLRADGSLVAFHSTLIPGAAAPSYASDPAEAAQSVAARLGQPLEIEAGEIALAVQPVGDRYECVEVHRLVLRGRFGSRFLALVRSRDLALLHLESLIRHQAVLPAASPASGAALDVTGVTRGLIKPLYAHELVVWAPFPWLDVHVADAPFRRAFSNATGEYRLNIGSSPAPIASQLEGMYVSVSSDAHVAAGFLADVSPGEQVDVLFDEGTSHDDERSIYYHTNVIHDYARDRLSFTLMDFPLPAVASVRNPRTGVPDYANAFWDGERMGFGNGGGGLQNFGLFADVVYHEYTHGITDYMYRPVSGLVGAIGAAIHEGLSDYFACTITGEPRIGEFLGGLDGFRNLDNALLWPEDRDLADEEHANGEIFGGALWHVRAAIGAAVADPVIHGAREFFPQTFETYMEAMLLQDDLLFGDGAPGNGSPHRDGILAGFGRHGMGPLGSREVRIVHHPLGDTEESEPRRVEAELQSLAAGVVDEVWLHYSTGAGFSEVRMLPSSPSRVVAEVPAQPMGTTVRYYLRTVRLRPRQQTTLPANAPLETFGYTVGPDTQPPQVEHMAFSQLAAFAFPPSIHARITDNLGIGPHYVEYWRNGQQGPRFGFVRSSEDPTAYRSEFPNAGGDVGDVFEYRIVAVDASRAANETHFPASGLLRFELVEILADNFEGGSAWDHESMVSAHPDPWHLGGLRNHSPSGALGWHCGNDAGEYPPSTAARLRTDWYPLGQGAVARVWSWMDAEPNGPQGAFDGGIVQVEADGQLVLLHPMGGYPRRMADTGGANVIAAGTPCLSGRDDAWQQLEFDLSAFAGKRVCLHFVFGSDNIASTFGYTGWTLDDFTLDAGQQDPTDAARPPGEMPRTLLATPPAPNPFNPSVHFALELPAAMAVTLDILDVRGRRLRRLLDTTLPAGASQLVWDGRDARRRPLPSGVYYFRLQWGSHSEQGKLVLTR